MLDLEAAVEITVPFHDCDPAGVAWHGNYLRYFDTARCALLDKINYGYVEMEASGYVWPIIDVKIRYVRTVRYHEVIRVFARLEEYEYRLKIAYVVTNDQDQVVTEGMTTQVAVDVAKGEMCLGSPEVLLQRLGVDE